MSFLSTNVGIHILWLQMLHFPLVKRMLWAVGLGDRLQILKEYELCMLTD